VANGRFSGTASKGLQRWVLCSSRSGTTAGTIDNTEPHLLLQPHRTVGIYWNNHHHLFHAVQKINGTILWANLYLLFWLSLLPFVTGWMGENHFSTLPVAVYGMVLLMAAIAYSNLELALMRLQGKDSQLAKAVGQDYKEKISLVIYAAAIPLSFVNRWLGLSLYVAVAVLWVIPDRRIEKKLGN
jgi:uncharacterized membrane protein